jgi:HK97 family phage prohead protease
MMSTPLFAPMGEVEVEVSEDGTEVQTPKNRFNSECYVEGYATTFDDPYLMFEDYDGWKYMEIIDRHALDDADFSDVIMQYDHQGPVYARNTNNTLYFEPNDHGLFVAADLSKTKQAREEMYEPISVGNVTRMSWAFIPSEEVYTEDRENKVFTTRITRVKKVFDVSAVSYPADPNTEISARNLVNGEIEARRQRESLQRETERMRREIALRAKRLQIR